MINTKASLYRTVSIVFLCLVMLPSVAISSNLKETKEALGYIADFADRICKDIPLKGTGESIVLSGSSKVEFNKLIKKLTDIGVEGLGQYSKHDYENVLQKNLLEALGDSRDCKIKIFNSLKDRVLPEERGVSNTDKNNEKPQKNKRTHSNKYQKYSQKLGNVQFYISEVTHTGKELQIWVMAYNEGADLETAIYFGSSITDDDGVSHDQTARMAGGRRGGLDYFHIDLPHKVPTKFGLAFSSVPPNIRTIPFAEIILRNLGTIQFRGVSVPYRESASFALQNNNINKSTSVRLGNVTYSLEKVFHNGRELQVWVNAINEGADINTGIYFASSLTDSEGNSHSQSARMSGGHRGGLDYFSVRFPFNVKTKFGLAFNTVPPDVTNIPFVNIILRNQGSVQFRDIAVPLN